MIPIFKIYLMQNVIPKSHKSANLVVFAIRTPIMRAKKIGEIGEIDSVMILMQSESGKLCHINNSRHASYGYDQRLEAHGSKGMIRSENHEQTTVERFDERGSSMRDPLPFFFIERYQQAFLDQLDGFIESIESNKPTQVTFEDGRRALILANAAYESLETGRTVKVNYVD